MNKPKSNIVPAITSFSGEYYFLSNFFPCDVWFEGHWYPTVEHAFQAAKTTNTRERRNIRYAGTPGLAKKLGRQVELRPDWERVKLGVMSDLLRQKFSSEPLTSKLAATKQYHLIEGNNWGDMYWGQVWKNGKWNGHNHLGKLLMEIRKEILEA